jgi:HAMP domain-containing protein
MSDHKWDRFKKAFGATPSNELLTGRDTKIGNELALVQAQIDRITNAGLDASALAVAKQAVEVQRQKALAIADAKQKYAALDKVKDAARKVVSVAKPNADQMLNELAADLVKERARVGEYLENAKNLKEPMSQQVIAPAIIVAQQAIQDAEGKGNDALKLAALKLLDPPPLKNEYNSVLMSVELGWVRVKNNQDKLAAGLAHLPAGDAKDKLLKELSDLNDRVAAVPNEADLQKLTTEVSALDKAFRAMVQKTSADIGDWSAHTDMMQPIKVVLDELAAIKTDTGKAIINTEKLALQRLVDSAEMLDPVTEKTKALKAIDLKPAKLILAEAQSVDNGVIRMLAGAKTMLDKLAEENPQKTTLNDEWVRLDGLAGGLKAETDLATAKKGYADILKATQKLLDDLITARGDKGYEDALEARFGVTVSGKEGAQINLKDAYAMLAEVPESHVGHDKVKALYFTASDEAGGAYGNAKISMDNFKPGGSETYKIDGKEYKANSFNVTMLHEIGHAVDDRHKIMDGLMNMGGYGKWNVEKKDGVRDIFVAEALKGMGTVSDDNKKDVVKLISDALSGTEASKPGWANRSQWAALKQYADIAVKITEAKKPWFNAAPDTVTVGGRVFVQAYGSQWYSFDPGEVQKTKVNNYQWRSPAEWFAEIYGITWLTKKEGPSQAGAEIKKWLPQPVVGV